VNYVSLYRKWRPQVFEDLIGQDHITRTLKNALKSGRISHAYLFCGPRGTGKTSAAKILAKALNCEKGTAPQPCSQCHICRGINKGNIMDVLEIDAASNRGIDEIRELREKVRFGSTQARFKVYIIDEVHMLTPEAFNALLKTLEEPPERVIFVLATTEPHKLPQTILSRCQRFDFHRIGLPIMVEGLSKIASQEGVNVEEEALKIIARSSEGGMRDALGLLEQVMAFCEGSVSLEAAKQILGLEEEDIFIYMGKAVLKNDLVAGLRLVGEVADRGRDISQFVRDLTGYFRSLIILKIQGEEPVDLDIPWVSLDGMKRQAEKFSHDGLMCINEILTGSVSELRGSSQPRFVLETAVFQICRLDFKLSLQNIESKIEKLEDFILERKEGVAYSYSEQPLSIEENRKDYAQQSQELEPVSEDTENFSLTDKNSQPVNTEESSIEEFNKIWKDFLKELHGKDVVAYSWLEQGRPSSYEGSTLTVELANCFAQDNLEKSKPKKVIEEILCGLTGKKVTVKFILSNNTEANGIEVSGEEHESSEDSSFEGSLESNFENSLGDSCESSFENNNTDIHNDEFVAEVLKIFKGKVVDHEETKKGGFFGV